MDNKKATTAQRLHQIMTDRNLRQVDILTLAEPYCKTYGVKLNKNDISQYCSGKVEPGPDKLTILGLTLGVSEPWLMGFDVSPDRSIKTVAGSSDGQTEEYIRLFALLDDIQKDFLIRAMKGLISEK